MQRQWRYELTGWVVADLFGDALLAFRLMQRNRGSVRTDQPGGGEHNRVERLTQTEGSRRQGREFLKSEQVVGPRVTGACAGTGICFSRGIA